jgi:hypothetical protein
LAAVGEAAWYFRVLEDRDGWICRRGRLELDRHPDLEAALDHIRAVAAANNPSRVFVHHLSGRVAIDTALG